MTQCQVRIEDTMLGGYGRRWVMKCMSAGCAWLCVVLGFLFGLLTWFEKQCGCMSGPLIRAHVTVTLPHEIVVEVFVWR